MEDAELVAAAKDGDEAAIESLVKKYLPQVLRLAARLAGQTELAEDIAQEAFVKAWRNLNTYDAAKPFAPWMLAITRNAALDLLRKRRAVPFSALSPANGEDGMDFADTLASEEPLPEEVLARAESDQTVAAALLRLPERDRTVLTLRYEGDGFLYKMVRLLTGTLIRCGQGRAELQFIKDLLAEKGKRKTSFAAPAEGLYLTRVIY